MRYDLREAVEDRARAERLLADQPSAANRDGLLDAQLNVEAKTQDAIEICHKCDEHHAPSRPRLLNSLIGQHQANVTQGVFHPEPEGGSH